MKFFETFEHRNEKADDLPRVYIVDYSDREVAGGGAPATGNGIDSVLRVDVTLSLQLVCDRRNGWLSSHAEAGVRKMGALSVRNLLIDTIERDDDGNVDCSLGRQPSRLDYPREWYF